MVSKGEFSTAMMKGERIASTRPLAQAEQRAPLVPKILFEDSHLIALAKPAGLLSQGEKRGDENLVDWLRGYLGRPYVGLVHRLDRNTSGLMVVAKRTKSADRLTQALQSGQIARSYLGWITGTLEKPERWAHRLLKDQERNIVQVVSPSHPRGKDAILVATPIQKGNWRGESITLVEFTLETGRSHQIRVQSANAGHPLLGDIKYGKSKATFPRPALHSHRLRFPHPMSGKIMEFEEPLPDDMAKLLTSSTP